jgi:hypothetical protein
LRIRHSEERHSAESQTARHSADCYLGYTTECHSAKSHSKMPSRMALRRMTLERMAFTRMTLERMTFTRMTLERITFTRMTFRRMTFRSMTFGRMSFIQKNGIHSEE